MKDLVDSLLPGNFLVCHQGTGTILDLAGSVLIDVTKLTQEEQDELDESGELPDSAYEYGVDMPAVVDYFFNN